VNGERTGLSSRLCWGSPTNVAKGSAPSSLSIAEPSQRVTALRRERDRLLKQIAAKKKELSRARAKTSDALGRMGERMGPLLAQRRDLEEEVHACFAQLLSAKGSRRQRASILLMYESLQAGGFIGYRAVSPETTDFAFDDDPPERSGGGYSAPQPGQAPTLRSLFKRLTVALHPDRVQHDDEKARRTQLMKEVTRAYEQGDLARLLELERLWCSAGAEVSAPDRETELIAALERTVRELKAQLRSVLDELRALRRSDEFHAAKGFRQAQDAGVDPLVEVLEETETVVQVLREVRDLALAFSAGKIAFAEFFAGPPSVRPGR
jgi:hypothetical protein